MLITYKQRETPTNASQTSFDDFYAALAAPQTAVPTLSYRAKQFYTTIETNEPSTETILQTIRKKTAFQNTFRARFEYFKDMDMDTQYNSFSIPKRSGGFRTINAPKEPLKKLLQDINKTLQGFDILPHNCAHAYVERRCIKDALEVHQKKDNSWFLKIDLHDFFGSCSKPFIITQLKQIPFFAFLEEDILELLLHVCMLNGGLPQGSPLSPWLTNQIMLPIDYKLNKLCHRHRIAYTRYADDLLFSSTSRNAVRHAQRLVEEVLKDTPLTINHAKTKISSIYGQNWNLGLMLNKDKQITVGNKRKENLRAALHAFCIAPNEFDYQSATEFLGKIQYYLSIEPEYFQAMLTKYNQKFNINIREKLIEIIKA